MRAIPSGITAATMLFGPLLAGTVNFDSGGGPGTILFEREDGSPLSGGTLFMGTFPSTPPIGISFAALLEDFEVFDAHDDPSGPAGNFLTEDFVATPTPGVFSGAKIFLVAVDGPVLADATQFALVSSTQPAWTFPTGDLGTASITLAASVDQFFAGSSDMITDPGGISGTFNSIQLTNTTPPPPPTVPMPETVVVSGQFGVEFNYPSSEADAVTFTLEATQSLLPDDWSTVASSASVVSDDGTTRRLRILHPDQVTESSRLFLRVLADPVP